MWRMHRRGLCRNDEKTAGRWKVKQLLEAGKDSNGEEVFGEMLDDMLFLSEMIDLQQVLFYLREKEGLSERMLDMLLTSILSNVDEISHKWEVYKDKAN